LKVPRGTARRALRSTCQPTSSGSHPQWRANPFQNPASDIQSLKISGKHPGMSANHLKMSSNHSGMSTNCLEMSRKDLKMSANHLKTI
jgi:hypothetical protein